MNDYEKKQAARKARLEAASDRAKAESASAYKAAHTIADGIPMGQPILVGHHSEKRHRRDIDKMNRNFDKASDLHDKAEGLARAAEAVGTAGISSDDPEAIQKLNTELAELEGARAIEKLWNAYIRRTARAEAKQLGVGAAQLTRADHKRIIEQSTMPDDFKRALISYANAFPWLPQFGDSTQNSIARVKARIAELTQRDATPGRVPIVGLVKLATPLVIEGETYPELGFELRENADANRCQIIFATQPPKDLREKLKRRGFKWAPSESAWQRMRSNGAWYDATVILGCKDGTPIDPPISAAETNADPEIYACPDGPACTHPECVAENQRRAMELDL